MLVTAKAEHFGSGGSWDRRCRREPHGVGALTLAHHRGVVGLAAAAEQQEAVCPCARGGVHARHGRLPLRHDVLPLVGLGRRVQCPHVLQRLAAVVPAHRDQVALRDERQHVRVSGPGTLVGHHHAVPAGRAGREVQHVQVLRCQA